MAMKMDIPNHIQVYNNLTGNSSSYFNSSSGLNYTEFPKFWLELTVMGIAVLAGNGLVCALFMRYRQLRTITNTFVVSLAFSDMLVAIALLPCHIQQLPGVPYIIAYILFASLFNFCAVTYDRYQAVLYPLTYRAKLTRKRVKKVLSVAWSAPIAITLIPLCWEHSSYSTKSVAGRIYMGLLVLVVTVFSLIVFLAYARIFKATRRHLKLLFDHSQLGIAYDKDDGPKLQQQSSRKRLISLNIAREVKASKVFALLGITFVVCWFPLIIINAFSTFGLDKFLPSVLADISLFSLVTNSLIDPIIYSLLKSDFRVALKSLLACPCCKIATRHKENSFKVVTSSARQVKKTKEKTEHQQNSTS